jgi:hypothetical protein
MDPYRTSAEHIAVGGTASRDSGLLRADIDVGLLLDPKFVRLLRLMPDNGERAITVLVYVQTLLASWREGRRMTAVEAEALWEVTPERMAVLHTLGLLDAQGRVPKHAWERWFEPARARISRRREAGRLAGLRSGEVRSRKAAFGGRTAKPSLNGRSTNVQRSRTITEPSQPPPPTVAGGGSGGAGPVEGPPRPPVNMSHLDRASTEAIETMLAGLAERDGRRRALREELLRRDTVEAISTDGASGAKA